MDDQHAAYLQDAFDAQDPFLIVLAMKEIGTARRVPVALDENPPLSEVLRAMKALGLRLSVDGTPGGWKQGKRPETMLATSITSRSKSE